MPDINPRRGVTIAETLMAAAIGGAMLALLLPAVAAAIANAQGSHCRNNIARLAQALNAYHDVYGKYPFGERVTSLSPAGANAGDERENWVIRILPYLGQQTLYDSVNWTQLATTNGGLTNYTTGIGVKYGAFTTTELADMKCPTDTFTGVQFKINRNPNHFGQAIYQFYARGNYSANSCLMPNYNYGTLQPPLAPAAGCGGPDQWAWSGPTSWRTRGIMGLNTSLSRGQITDGTSSTILIGETRAGINAFDPRGLWADGRPAGSTTWFHYYYGPNGCFDDLYGDLNLFLNALAPGNTALAHQLALQQCMDAYNTQSLRGTGTFRSLHPGGLFAAMADGSVRFISSTVDRGFNATPGIYEYSFDTNDANILPAIRTWERLNASGDGLVVDDSTDPNFSSTVVRFVLGDMNGDGVMDNFDISAMELALVDPAAYLTTYPTLTDYQQRGDINQDGVFNNFDILAFEQMLMGSN